MAFPAGTPTLEQVDALWEGARNQIEYRFILEGFNMWIDDQAKQGKAVGGWVDGIAIPRKPMGYTEENAARLKHEARKATTQTIKSIKAAYTPYFDKGQEAELGQLWSKYTGFRGTLNQLHESPHIKKAKDYTEEWDEKAAEPFQKEFMQPLEGAITRHRDIAKYLAGAVALEAWGQVAIRKAFAELPVVACGGGSTKDEAEAAKKTKDALETVSDASGFVGLALFKFPVAGVVVGAVGLVASALADSINPVVVSLEFPDVTTMEFTEWVGHVNTAITSLTSGLDKGRDDSAKALRDDMIGAYKDLENWKTLPRHYVPGGELLD
ncbi:hypothetical protein [Glycomyces sp. NPDC048151]|uniref:hypothetical protein n=1 Tax=Glycomyces sp. NPDC048151 TaxID=3364002 RepID=UPI00371D111B